MAEVHLSMSEYRELESAKNALDAILKDKQKYSVVVDYGKTYYINSLDVLAGELATQLQHAVEARDATIKKWKELDPKSFNRINR